MTGRGGWMIDEYQNTPSGMDVMEKTIVLTRCRAWDDRPRIRQSDMVADGMICP